MHYCTHNLFLFFQTEGQIKMTVSSTVDKTVEYENVNGHLQLISSHNVTTIYKKDLWRENDN